MIDRNDPLGLLRLVPRIKRARAYRLYAETGSRLVDLWQYGGAAILGHTPARVLTVFKDTASRGLFCPLPSSNDRRFEQSLARLVPGRAAVRWYAGPEEADRALAAAGFEGLSLSAFRDPAVEDVGPECEAALWRPWAPTPRELALPRILAPVVPLPHPSRPIAFLLPEELAPRFPSSGPASPVVLAAASRALADLSNELSRDAERPSLRLAGKIGSIPGCSLRGPYLVFAESTNAEAYALLFGRLLSRGFLLPPDPSLPAILPETLSEGEEKALMSAIADR